MSQELLVEGTRSTRIVALDIGCRKHYKEREQIQVGLNISSAKRLQKVPLGDGWINE